MDESKQCIILARKEFTSILIYYLYPSIYQGIKSIWEDAKKSSLPREVYQNFQNRLIRVRKWNQDVIDHEYKRIVNKTKCEWLNDLIKKVFVLNTQILAATNVMSSHNKIKVKVPSAEKFIHVCYMECARSFFENALYMEDRPSAISKIEQSKNLQKSYKLIMQCIENAIRTLLPIESLVTEDYTANEGEDATPLPQLYKSLSPYNITNGNIEINKLSDVQANSMASALPSLPAPIEGLSSGPFDPLNLPGLENFELPKSPPKLPEDSIAVPMEDPLHTKSSAEFDNTISFQVPPNIPQEPSQESSQGPSQELQQNQPEDNKFTPLDFPSIPKDMNVDFSFDLPEGMNVSEPKFEPMESVDLSDLKKSLEKSRDEGESDNNSIGDVNIPIVSKSKQELDLDVDSVNDKQKERKMPAIDDFDSKSFFSDAED